MITLINPFEIQVEDENDFLTYWQGAADYMQAQEGFISSQLHKSIMPGSRFMFINVAEWASAEEFKAAINSDEFKALTAQDSQRFPHFPSLYQSVRVVEKASKAQDVGA